LNDSHDTSSQGKIRIAVVGCGRISEKHFGAIEAHGDQLQLVGVCDNDPQRLQAAEQKRGAPGYRDLDSLLREARPALVVLATPSGHHPEQTIRIA